MITILLYLKNVKRPFEICFERHSQYQDFILALSDDIVTIGPLTFAKTEFKYFVQKIEKSISK